MATYRVNRKEIIVEDAGVLMEAVARYMSSTPYPDTEVIAAILSIEKDEEDK